jgi:ankyrin repeat protein
MISEDDIHILYVNALEGNIEHVQFLTTNIKFDFIHLVKAYRYCLERGLKLQSNDKLREDIHHKINTLRNNRKLQIDKLNISGDLSLLEQGALALECSKYLFTLLEPYLTRQEQVTILFFYLCKMNNLIVVKDFITAYIDYIDFDYQNEKGRTVLHIACKNNNDHIIAFLLPYCNPMIQDYHDKNPKKLHNTPLHYAVITRNILIIKLLLSYHLDLNIKNYYDLTPLYDVAPGENGHLTIFELLLSNGANINIKCNHKTLLYKLVEDNDAMGVAYLLSKGADPYITSTCHFLGKSSKVYYETPLMLATDTIYEEVEDQINNMKIITYLIDASKEKYIL